MADPKGKNPGEKLKDSMAEPMMAAGAAMKETGMKVAENSSALTARVLDHAEANTREAFAALRAAAQSTSITDILKLQGDYVRDQSSRSMNQAREIGELIAKFGRESVETIRNKD